MPAKPQIVDETNDRKYFALIPNYITNHSTFLEQGLYLTMKRIAGESGVCFASQKEIAIRGGVSQQTVSRTIEKLINRGWIKADGWQPGKTKPIKKWRIVDLWQLNMDYYNKPKDEIVNVVSKSSEKDRQRSEYKNVNVVSKEEDIYEEDKYILLSNDNSSNFVAEKNLNDLIKLFKPLNPSYENLYKNNTQRKALTNLVKKHGFEKIQRCLEKLPEIVSRPYAPVITTPCQLENKLGELVLFMRKEAQPKKGGTIVV